MNSKTIFAILAIVTSVGIVAGLSAVSPVHAIQSNSGFGAFSLGTVQSTNLGANAGTVGLGNTAPVNACGALAVC